MTYNPQIIAQILSTQSVYISRIYGQMFYFTDLRQIWYDTQDNNRIFASDIVILNYERDRNNFIPDPVKDFPTEIGYESNSTLLLDYSMVYVIETNCLYKYQNGIWTIIYGVYGSTTVAQTYLPDGTIKVVVPDDVTTNGILNDGSVVVRDNNKMICGLLKSDGYTFNILGLIGGQINIDPSGSPVNEGCLQVNQNMTNINGDLVIFGDIKKAPKEDWNKQYRLVTEDISILSNTTLAKGSTLIKGSKFNKVTYDKDTVLTEDLTYDTTDNTNVGLIVKGSKLYKNSIVNDSPLKPPFVFDTEAMNITSI